MGEIKIITVVFCDHAKIGRQSREEQEKEYAYLTDIDVEHGDLVVVPTGLPTLRLFHTARVIATKGLFPGQSAKATKWIVAKIDTAEWDAKMAKYQVLQEIRNKLRQYKEQAEEFIIYQTLAAHNPEIKNLLDEFTKLGGTMGLPEVIAPPSFGTIPNEFGDW